jgi:ketosteroid isomerase-like protein
MSASSSYDRNAQVARAFVDAFNRREIDDFLLLLSDDIEVRTPRGVKRGRREIAEWFERPFDHLDLELTGDDYLLTGEVVVGWGLMRFRWRETGEIAEEKPAAAVWRIEDGLIRHWQPFPELYEALRFAGVLPAAA